MKKSEILGAALFALFALGAMASSAMASPEFLLAEWLFNGLPVTGTLPVEGSGSLLLEDTNTLIGKVAILCEAIGDGTVGLNGEGEITKLLNAKKEEIGTPLVGLALEEPDCKNEVECPKPLVWLENLPWRGLAELMVDGGEEFWVGLTFAGGGGNPAWEIECMGAIPLTDLCQAAESVNRLQNGVGDVEGEDSEAFTELAGVKLGLCSQGGSESAFLEGVGLLSDTEAGTLSISS